MKKAAENTEEFLTLMKEWQVLEDQTIASADELLKKTNNPLITMTMEMIRNDSEKHKAMIMDGSVPYNDPGVRQAYETYGKWAMGPTYTVGGG